MTSEMRPLISSHLERAVYDQELRVLHIEFKDGGTYEYDDVPKDIGDGLFTAASPGRYFKSFIKGRFIFRKV